MGEIITEANSAFRDFAIDGVAASGAHKPVKSEIRALFATVEHKIGSSAITPEEFGAVGDGIADDTAAINAAEAARQPGQSLVFGSGPYKITGDVTMTKPGQWVLPGTIINSTAGRMLVATSDGAITGSGGATFNFAGGDPALSLDRAIRVHGSWSGATGYGASPVTLGATAFTATSAGDAATVGDGDWIIIGGYTAPDYQYFEWKRVRSVSGTTVNVYDPFRRAYTGEYPLLWHKVTPWERVTIEGLKITTSAPENVGTDIQLARETTIRNCTYDISPSGLAFFHFLTDQSSISDFIVVRQPGRMSTMSSATNWIVRDGHFQVREAAPTNGALMLETGSSTGLAQNLTIDNASGGTGGIFGQWVDDNIIHGCKIATSGAPVAIGIHILGGVRNRTEMNKGTKLYEIVRFNTDTGKTPPRAGSLNTSSLDQPTGCTYGVDVVGGTGNRVLDILDDGTNGTPFFDTGTGTILSRKSGPFLFLPDISFNTPGNLVTAYGTQYGEWEYDGRWVKGYVDLHPTTFTFSTAAGQMLVLTDPTMPPALAGAGTQVFAGQITGGWNKAGYTDLIAYVGAGDRRIAWQVAGPGKVADVLVAADFTSGASLYINAQFRYRYI